MFQGNLTNEHYNSCLIKGFCENHRKELEISVQESYEVQRKAFLYLRLQIFSPLLFEKPFTFDKMKSLFTDKSFGSRKEADFHEKILYLDAVIVFTLCHFSQICCLGALFKNDQQSNCIQFKGGTRLEILMKKSLLESDISYLVPLLKENFNGNQDHIYKIGFVATMLIVRNVSLSIKLKDAIEQLDKELKSTPEECRAWLIMGSASHQKQQFSEAINAYSQGLKYSPYCIPLLLQRAEVYKITDKLVEAALDLYIILMIEPQSLDALCKYVDVLYKTTLFHDCIKAAEFGIENCEESVHKHFLLNMKSAAEILTGKNKKKEHIDNPMLNQAIVKDKDIPELIEASDSETEAQDVPELMEASDDSSSESEPTADTMERAISKPETTVITAGTIKDQLSPTRKVIDEWQSSSSKEYTDEIFNQIKCLLKEASQKLIDEDIPSAIRKYREALDEIKASPMISKYTEGEIVCIKYALGTSYSKSGGFDDLQRAITVYKGITEEHSSVTFPAAYFGIALAYRQLNRFKEALHYLQIVEDILEQGAQIEFFFWPVSTVAIDETKFENLKTLVNDLTIECENPPRPEATCRFHDCSLQPAIYYTDPDFKGFFAIQCSEQCTLQYHPSCWKLLKTEKHFSDKEFLDQNCITPDCEGTIIKIENIDKERNLGKIFESADSKKSTKKKTKLEKKLEVKEEKKRKRKDSSSKTEVVPEAPADATNENQASSETHPDSNKSDTKTEAKEKFEGSSMPSETPISANTEHFTVLKKEKLVDETTSKHNSKVKEHKKAKNTLTIEEFLERTDNSGTEYQQRLHVLRQNNEQVAKASNHNLKATAPSFKPQRVSDFAEIETTYGLDDFPQMPSAVSTSPVNTNSLRGAESMDSAFSPSSMLLGPEFSVECAKKNIYSYIKNILCKYGPLREDDPILVQELQGFPGEANALIADSKGLGKFLAQSIEFAFVGETYVCTVDQIAEAYDKINDLQLTNGHSGNNYSLDDFGAIEDPFQYSLNPDAREYSPAQAVGRNPPQLVSAISKLRQPLAVDGTFASENSVDLDQSVTLVHSNAQALDPPLRQTARKKVTGWNIGQKLTVDLTHTQENSADSGTSVPVGNSSPGNGQIPNPPTRLQVARQVAEAVKVYFSPDSSEFRSYIRQFIQPYAIVEGSKKSNVYVQTENTQDTMIKEEELQRLKELITILTEDNVSLKGQIELLGEQLEDALDNVTKSQKKMNVELPNLKKELEDANLELEEQKKESKKRECKLEKEIKVLSESLKKSKEEQAAQKCDMDNLQTTHKNMELSMIKAEERINLLRNEKHILKTTLDLQKEKLQDNLKNLEADKKNVLKRAEAAELALLHLKKTDYLKCIDNKATEALHRMKEMQEGLSNNSTNLNPLVIENFQALISQIKNYIIKLHETRIDFSTKIDEQMNAVKNGTPIEQLPPLEMKKLPEIPHWKNPLPMQNGIPSTAQFSNWMAQAQMLSSATLNANPSNAYPHLPNFQQMQSNQQAFLQRYPHLSPIGQGAIPNLSIPTASSIQNPKKPPPGLPNPHLDFRTTPEVIHPANQPAPTVSQAANYPAGAVSQAIKQPAGVVSQASNHPAGAVSQASNHPAGAVSQAAKQVAGAASQASNHPAGAVSQASKQAAGAVSQAAKQATGAVSHASWQVAGASSQAAKQAAGAVSPAPPHRPDRPLSQPSASVSQAQSVPLPQREDTAFRARASSSGWESCESSNVSVHSSTSKSSLDDKMACDNNDALELDYNVKKKNTKKATVPTSANASSSKSVYEKLSLKLQPFFPNTTVAQRMAIVKNYRDQKSSMKGLTIDMIVNEIRAMEDVKRRNESARSETVQRSRMIPSIPLVNKKLASDVPKPSVEQNGSSKKSAWGVGGDSSKQWAGKSPDEEACCICFEEMTPRTAYKVDCGHYFHLNCIKEWLNKKSDCPKCRVHLLLPEDYPAL